MGCCASVPASVPVAPVPAPPAPEPGVPSWDCLWPETRSARPEWADLLAEADVAAAAALRSSDGPAPLAHLRLLRLGAPALRSGWPGGSEFPRPAPVHVCAAIPAPGAAHGPGDMAAELSVLSADVWPYLESFAARLGLEFRAVGAAGGAADVDRADLGLPSLAHCRAARLGPEGVFALVLLGNDAGDRPLPARMPAAEFDALAGFLAAEKETFDAATLIYELWELDTNMVTPEGPSADSRSGSTGPEAGPAGPAYVLRPRPNGTCEAAWRAEVAPAAVALRFAAAACAARGTLSAERAAAYGHQSVVDRELHSALRLGAGSQAATSGRIASGKHPASPSGVLVLRRTFVTADGSAAGPPPPLLSRAARDAAARLADLRAAAGPPGPSVRDEDLPCGEAPGDATAAPLSPLLGAHASYMRRMADWVCGALARSMLEGVRRTAQQPPPEAAKPAAGPFAPAPAPRLSRSLLEEVDRHWAIARACCGAGGGPALRRPDVLAAVDAFIRCSGSTSVADSDASAGASAPPLAQDGAPDVSGPMAHRASALVLHAPPGDGKTHALAACAVAAAASGLCSGVVLRLCGATPAASDPAGLVRSLSQQVAALAGHDPRSVRGGLLMDRVADLRARLHAHVEALTAAPLLLVIDGLDELRGGGNDGWAWLAQLLAAPLPPHALFLLSARALPAPRADPLAVLRQLEADSAAAGAGTGAVGAAVVRLFAPAPVPPSAWLDCLLPRHRSLTPAQAAALADAAAACPRPLYLALACNVARGWVSRDPPFVAAVQRGRGAAFPDEQGLPLGGSLDHLLKALFVRLERAHTPALVQSAVGLLLASRHGLSRGELLACLTRCLTGEDVAALAVQLGRPALLPIVAGMPAPSQAAPRAASPRSLLAEPRPPASPPTGHTKSPSPSPLPLPCRPRLPESLLMRLLGDGHALFVGGRDGIPSSSASVGLDDSPQVCLGLHLQPVREAAERRYGGPGRREAHAGILADFFGGPAGEATVGAGTGSAGTEEAGSAPSGGSPGGPSPAPPAAPPPPPSSPLHWGALVNRRKLSELPSALLSAGPSRAGEALAFLSDPDTVAAFYAAGGRGGGGGGGGRGGWKDDGGSTLSSWWDASLMDEEDDDETDSGAGAGGIGTGGSRPRDEAPGRALADLCAAAAAAVQAAGGDDAAPETRLSPRFTPRDAGTAAAAPQPSNRSQQGGAPRGLGGAMLTRLREALSALDTVGARDAAPDAAPAAAVRVRAVLALCPAAIDQLLLQSNVWAAQEVAQAADAAAARMAGKLSAEAAISLEGRARVESRIGRLDTALATRLRALAACEASMTAEPLPRSARALARCLRRVARGQAGSLKLDEEAISTLRRAIALYEVEDDETPLGGNDQPSPPGRLLPGAGRARGRLETTAAYAELARLLLRTGDAEGALSLLDRVTRLRSDLLGRFHPAVGHGHAQRGFLLRRMGHLPAALSAYRRAWESARAAYGNASPCAMHARAGVGALLLDMGRTGEAIAEFRAAVAGLATPEHPVEPLSLPGVKAVRAGPRLGVGAGAGRGAGPDADSDSDSDAGVPPPPRPRPLQPALLADGTAAAAALNNLGAAYLHAGLPAAACQVLGHALKRLGMPPAPPLDMLPKRPVEEAAAAAKVEDGAVAVPLGPSGGTSAAGPGGLAPGALRLPGVAALAGRHATAGSAWDEGWAMTTRGTLQWRSTAQALVVANLSLAYFLSGRSEDAGRAAAAVDALLAGARQLRAFCPAMTVTGMLAAAAGDTAGARMALQRAADLRAVGLGPRAIATGRAAHNAGVAAARDGAAAAAAEQFARAAAVFEAAGVAAPPLDAIPGSPGATTQSQAGADAECGANDQILVPPAAVAAAVAAVPAWAVDSLCLL